MFRADDTRSPVQRALALGSQTVSLARLPPSVARFYLRALRSARAHEDRWSLDVATRPHELADVLRAARGASVAVEIGTATGWTTIALALADRGRTVHSFDPFHRDGRQRYLALVAPETRERITMHAQPGDASPLPQTPRVDFLFVDGEHTREATVASFEAWRDRLAPDAVVAFHDYGDPAYPGVAEAIEELGLTGSVRGRLFTWEADGRP